MLAAGTVEHLIDYSGFVQPQDSQPAWFPIKADSVTAALNGQGYLFLKDPGQGTDRAVYGIPDLNLDASDSVIYDAFMSIGVDPQTDRLDLGGNQFAPAVGMGFDDGQHLIALYVLPAAEPRSAHIAFPSGQSVLIPDMHLPRHFRLVKYGTSFVEAGVVDQTTGWFTPLMSAPLDAFGPNQSDIPGPGYFFGATGGTPGEGHSTSFWRQVRAVTGCTTLPQGRVFERAACIDAGPKGSSLGELIIIPNSWFSVRPVSGSFQLTDSFGHFSGNGQLEIGLTPQGNSAFLPLIELNGDANFTGATLTANGQVREVVSPARHPLFDGSWQIDISQYASKFIQLGAGQKLQVGGVDVALSKIELLVGGIGLHGQMQIPLGDGGIPLHLDNLYIVPQGILISGGACLPDQQFSLLDMLDIRATNLCASYDPVRNALKLQGRVSLPGLYNAVADFSGNNYIEVSPAGVSVAGSLSIRDITFPGGQWGLQNASLFLNTDTNQVSGSAAVKIPSGHTVAAGLGFFDGDLNSASIDIDGLNFHLHSGAVLQRVAGSVDHLSSKDPAPTTFGGGVGATFGPEISGIQIPSWVPVLGGRSLGGSLARFDLNGLFNSNQLQMSGPLKIIGDLVQGNSEIAIDWSQWSFSGDVSLNMLNNVIEVEGRFSADSRANLSVGGSAFLRLPRIACPVVCGQRVAGAHADFEYSNDGNFHNDYIQGYGIVNLGWFGTYYAGVIFRLDGSFSPINSMVDPIAKTIPVAAGSDRFIFAVDWENEVGDVAVELEAPDGTRYTAADFDDMTIGLISEWADPTFKAIGVKNPMAGDWTIHVPESDNLGAVEFHGFFDTEAPSVSITSLDSETGTIHFNASDGDSDAKVALYFDRDNQGFDGSPIVGDLPEVDGNGNYVWDRTGIPSGDYFIYARAQDENNPPSTMYSTATIRVANQAPELASIGDRNALVGEELFFTVSAIDANHERITFSLDAGAPEGASIHPITGEFSWWPAAGQPPGSYQITVRAMDNGLEALSDSETITIQVSEASAAPTWDTIEHRLAEEHVEIAFTAHASDINAGDSVSYSLGPDAPVGATIDPVTGAFSWTPGEEQDGQHLIVFHAQDSEGQISATTVTFRVSEVNDAPIDAQLDVSAVREKIAGATVGSLVAADPDSEQTHAFTTEDPRFEIVDNVLKLKSDQFVNREVGDTVTVDVTIIDSGTPYRATTRQLTIDVQANAKPWHYETLPVDSNGDGQVVPLDALRVINQLNSRSLLAANNRLPEARPANSDLPFYDVNGDGFCTSNDVLRIVNYLSAQNNGEGESPSAVQPSVGSFVWFQYPPAGHSGFEPSLTALESLNSAFDDAYGLALPRQEKREESRKPSVCASKDAELESVLDELFAGLICASEDHTDA